MSRNKQVDRLRAGMQEHWTGKIVDPVGAALGLMDVYRKDLALSKEFFEGLHAELVHVGCTSELIIERRNSTPISLGELGFVTDEPKVATDEDRARLITIVGMVINWLGDKGRRAGKEHTVAIERLNKKFSLVCDALHKALMELGIWDDPMAGTFNDMFMAFRDTYSKISRDNTFLEEALEGRDAEILSLKAQLKSANTWRNTQTEIIERLTKELNYQLSATEQYRKELDQMRESIIKSRPGQ